MGLTSPPPATEQGGHHREALCRSPAPHPGACSPVTRDCGGRGTAGVNARGSSCPSGPSLRTEEGALHTYPPPQQVFFKQPRCHACDSVNPQKCPCLLAPVPTRPALGCLEEAALCTLTCPAKRGHCPRVGAAGAHAAAPALCHPTFQSLASRVRPWCVGTSALTPPVPSPHPLPRPRTIGHPLPPERKRVCRVLGQGGTMKYEENLNSRFLMQSIYHFYQK